MERKTTILSLLLLLAFSLASKGQNNIFQEDNNVGIGTEHPDNVQGWNRVLDILGSGHAKLLVRTGEIKTGIFSHQDWGNMAIGRIGTESNHDLGLMAGYGNIVMSLKTNGYVGVGTSSPVGKLDVRGATFIGTGDLNIGSTGSFVQIDQGNGSGNSYTQIRAFSNGGNLANNLILQNSPGFVGIGTTTPNEKLSVNGKIRAQEIKVETANWPDYVFDQDYKVLGLNELNAYIKQHKHLPDMPSSKEAEANGVELGEMNKLLLKKVEELTLHLIEKDKQILSQEKNLKAVDEKYNQLSELVSKLIKTQNHE